MRVCYQGLRGMQNTPPLQNCLPEGVGAGAFIHSCNPAPTPIGDLPRVGARY